jgi:hypothetical protein
LQARSFLASVIIQRESVEKRLLALPSTSRPRRNTLDW